MESGFFGTGWKFPVEVEEATGRIKMASDEEDIKEAIRIIIGTFKGERVMRPDFGCEIQKFVFEAADTTTLYLLESKVKHAIETWESRVERVKIDAKYVENEYGKLIIDVSYQIINTNTLQNLSYPVYMMDGMK